MLVETKDFPALEAFHQDDAEAVDKPKGTQEEYIGGKHRGRAPSASRSIKRPSKPEKSASARPANLFSSSENCGENVRAAPPVKHRNNPEGMLVRGISNQVVTHSPESKRAIGQVGPSMTDVWRGNQLVNRGKKIFADPTSCKGTISCNKFPDVCEILGSLRV